MKASDIPDLTLLAVIDHVNRQKGYWANNGDIQMVMEEAGVPDKVILAKCARLKKRKLVDGCACGCRGDWELTQAGANLLASESAS